MKKTIAILTLLILISFHLSGCADKELMKRARNAKQSLETSGLKNLYTGDEDYGTIAYQYLEYIQENFPGRIAGSEKEEEMAVFILSVLLDGGYSMENIKIQDFKIDETSAPAQAIDDSNSFHGGTQTNKSRNIEVLKKGDSEKTIIVGAHYDSAGTHGVIDNGSGVSVLLENALRMLHTETPYTIRYVFFGGEEIGLCGSRTYVKKLSPEDKKNLLLMINVDCVAVGDISYLYGGNIQADGSVTDTWPAEQAFETAQELGLDIQLPPKGNPDYPFPTGQKRSDFAPFSDAGIPYIYFESNDWENGYPEETKEFGVLTHTQKDNLDFLNQTFPERVPTTLASYSELLYGLLEIDIAK